MKDTSNIEIYGYLRIKDPNTNKIFVDRKTDQPKKEIEQNERFSKATSRRFPDNKR